MFLQLENNRIILRNHYRPDLVPPQRISCSQSEAKRPSDAVMRGIPHPRKYAFSSRFVISSSIYASKTPFPAPLDGNQIGKYIFDAKTGKGTPKNGPDPVIDKTILNQLSTQLVINATAQSAKFNPLFTLISFLPMIY